MKTLNSADTFGLLNLTVLEINPESDHKGIRKIK
jgi:hypothetical protein